MKLLSTVPVNNAVGIYLDAEYVLTFDAQIDASYTSSTFFQLYRSNDIYSDFYELVGLTATVDGSTLKLKPMIALQQNSYYMLLVMGGDGGIADIDGSKLSDNITLQFRTGSMITPTPVPITNVDITTDASNTYVDGSAGNDKIIDSTDLFVQSGDIPIVYITSVPGNNAIGVPSVQRVTFIYDSDVDANISPNLLTGYWGSLPVDPDPLGDKYISAESVKVVGNKVAFDFGSLDSILPSGTVNTEFTFTLPMYSIRGTTKHGYDTAEHKIKFAGKLEPLYATPDQIRKRLSGWGESFNIPISDYDIYKLIHEKSSLLRYVYDVKTETTADLIRVNQSTICLVLRDIVGVGTLLNGNIQSRQILQNTITYENVDPSDVLSELSKCIEENTPEVTTLDGVQLAMAVSGIKSQNALLDTSGKDTKQLGVSSRVFHQKSNYKDNLNSYYPVDSDMLYAYPRRK